MPCSTHICEKPLPLQTSLQRTGSRVYSAALCLPHILLHLGRTKLQRVAASSFHLERQVPFGTHRCNRPALQQTSLRRTGLLHLLLRFLSLQMGRQIFLLCSRFLRIFVTVLFYTKKREYYGKRECRCRKEQCRKT